MFFSSIKEHFVDAISAGVREVERKLEDAKTQLHIRGHVDDSFPDKCEKFLRLVQHPSWDVRSAASEEMARAAVTAKRGQVSSRSCLHVPATRCPSPFRLSRVSR
jgi:hypothetical protein